VLVSVREFAGHEKTAGPFGAGGLIGVWITCKRYPIPSAGGFGKPK